LANSIGFWNLKVVDMTTQTEALDMITKLQLAHQAMEAACERIDQLKAENKALKEALAHPELIQQPASIDEMHDIGNGIMYWAQTEQEPVAWMTPDGEGFRIRFSPPVNDVPLGWDALYLTPPQRTWVGLTNDEVNNFAAGCHFGKSVQGAIYEAEAKLKDKNNG